MSWVATAVVGGAVIGGVASDRAASKSAEAAETGAQTSAQAQVEATQLQVDEIARQFDYQQRVLQPQIERQYGAQGAFSDLMGIDTPSLDFGAGGGEPAGEEFVGGSTTNPAGIGPIEAPRGGFGERPLDEQTGRQPALRYGQSPERARFQTVQDRRQPTTLPAQRQGGQTQPQTTEFQRGERGEFIDPNLDPTRLAETEQLTEQVAGSRLAPTDPEDDPLRNFIAERSLAEGAAGTGVYGEEFEESPGYDFQVEEMNRALDRRNSAGGNYGGRAIMEAQRRGQGLAAQDYHNWARGRTMDLQRQAQAEAQDITRGDAAFENYLGRRTQDTARMDEAVAEQDRLRGVDLQRRDQGYYNYINALAQQAGFGNPASQAVQASQRAGAQTAGAYAQQGSGLSQIYGNLGGQQAQIQQNRYANINNAAQSGIQNWMTYQALQG